MNLVKRFLVSYIRSKRFTRGQAVLSLVFLIGGTVVLIGTTLAFLVISFINATFGYQAANRALGIAFAGANDGLWKLSKDRDFGGSLTEQSLCDYLLPVGSDQARVAVVRKNGVCGSPKPISPNEAWIYSEANYLGRVRKIDMTVAIDPVAGRVEVTSMAQSVIVGGGGTGF